MVDRIGRLLGENRSGVLRAALLSYAKEVGAVEERLFRVSGTCSR